MKNFYNVFTGVEKGSREKAYEEFVLRLQMEEVEKLQKRIKDLEEILHDIRCGIHTKFWVNRKIDELLGSEDDQFKK